LPRWRICIRQECEVRQSYTASLVRFSAYVFDYLRLRPDVAVQANSIEAVAAKREIDPQRLRSTIDAYNSKLSSETGASSRLPLDSPPWVLLGPAKAYFTTTEGGAAIDRYFRVLTRVGKPIPGLFAVGQNGLGGMILWGHGLHIAWALTSGRMAGQIVARGECSAKRA
jgi:fumarate reductase flavoprotein subunit